MPANAGIFISNKIKRTENIGKREEPCQEKSFQVHWKGRGGKTMNWIVDRIEKNRAVIEDEQGNFFNVPTQALPSESQEGDVIELNIDREKTKQRKITLRAKMPGK